MSEMVHITFGNTVIAVRRDIELPNDPVLHAQLDNKLQEYRSRLLTPDLTPHREASTNYKIWVLQQLLDQGGLDFLVLKAAVAKDATNQTLAIAYLAYAWKVIENYCYNRGTQNRGGTGLPEAGSESALPFGGQLHEPQAAEESVLPFMDRPVGAVPMESRSGSGTRSRIPFLVDEEPAHPTSA